MQGDVSPSRKEGTIDSQSPSPLLTERKTGIFPAQPAKKPVITLQMIKGSDDKKITLEQKQILKSRTEGQNSRI